MERLLKNLSFIALFSFVAIANGEPALEAYGRLEQVTNVRISPNGELIAFRRTESDDEDFIVIYSLKEKKSITAINVKKTNINDHYFANNDFLILRASNHLDLANYRNFTASMAFSYDIKKNKTEPLVKLGERISGKKTVTVGQTGLGRLVGQSEDGKVLYMPAFVELPIYKLDSSGRKKGLSYSLLAVNVDGKGRLKTIDQGTPHTRDFFLDDKGKLLARENLNDLTNVHSIEVLEGKKWKTIYSYESKLKTHDFVGMNEDFSALVFSRDDDNVGQYLQLSLRNGEVEPLQDLQVSKDTRGLIDNEFGVVLGLRFGGLLPDYFMADPILQDRIQAIVSKYEGHSVHLVDWTPDWKHIVVRVEGTQSVGDYFLFSTGEAPAFIVSSRFDIEADDINPIATTRFKARDGLMIPTILTLPKSKMDDLKRLPTVILPHGGPASHDQVGFDYMAQALASRGYLVIQPQFRGSTGFGTAHKQAGNGEWGKGMQDDLSDAVNTFVDNEYVDPERVCIVGASYGGYASLAAAAFTPDKYDCAVSIAGVSHLPKMLAADKELYGRASWVLDYWNKSILAGDFDKDALKQISPYFSAQKIKIPVLLLHGENDTVVEYEQSRLMSKAIKKANGDVRLVKLKDDDHYLQNSKTRIQAVKETVEFVEKHIGS